MYFSGKVLTRSNEPVEKALVDVYGHKAMTNVNGDFMIIFKVEKSSQTRYVLNIHKEGFGFYAKIYYRSVISGVWHLTKATMEWFDPTKKIVLKDKRKPELIFGSLSSRIDREKNKFRRFPYDFKERKYNTKLPKQQQKTMDFIENANTINEGISISIPPNTLVDENGKPPKGKVLVSLSTVDVFDPESMPGDFTVNLGDRLGLMLTYGAGSIEIRDKTKKYQLKKKAEATLNIPVNDYQIKISKPLEDKIPLLFYNRNDGMWYDTERMAELAPDGQSYSAEINHLSEYNLDYVFSDYSCMIVDSTHIFENYEVEISFPLNPSYATKRRFIDNLETKIHYLYRLPKEITAQVRAIYEDVDHSGEVITSNETLILWTSTTDTGLEQPDQTVIIPDNPDQDCHGRAELRTPPTFLSILNDLPSADPDDSTDTTWLKLNTIVSILVAQTKQDLKDGNGVEFLVQDRYLTMAVYLGYGTNIDINPLGGIRNNLDLRNIALPGGQTLAPDQNYWILIRCGYWEYDDRPDYQRWERQYPTYNNPTPDIDHGNPRFKEEYIEIGPKPEDYSVEVETVFPVRQWVATSGEFPDTDYE